MKAEKRTNYSLNETSPSEVSSYPSENEKRAKVSSDSETSPSYFGTPSPFTFDLPSGYESNEPQFDPIIEEEIETNPTKISEEEDVEMDLD